MRKQVNIAVVVIDLIVGSSRAINVLLITKKQMIFSQFDFFSLLCHKRQKVCLSLSTDYLLYVSAWNRICYMLYHEEVCTATNIDNFVFCWNTFLRQIPLIRIHFRIYEMNPLSKMEYRVQSELFRFDNSKKNTKRFQMILISIIVFKVLPKYLITKTAANV